MFIHSSVDGWILCFNMILRLGVEINYFCQCRVIFLWEKRPFAKEQSIHAVCASVEDIAMLPFWGDMSFFLHPPWAAIVSPGEARGWVGKPKLGSDPASFAYQPWDGAQSPLVSFEHITNPLCPDIDPPGSMGTLCTGEPSLSQMGKLRVGEGTGLAQGLTGTR